MFNRALFRFCVYNLIQQIDKISSFFVYVSVTFKITKIITTLHKSP